MSTGSLKKEWRLVADIGATHTRFALTDRGHILEQIKIFSTSDFPDLATAVKHYRHQSGQPDIRHAAIGIANPVTGDSVHMTNSSWAFSIEATRKSLNLESLELINDFTALALSLPLLSETDLIKIGSGCRIAGAPLGLIGPGTGLGVSGLIPSGKKSWVPLAGEGGHASFAPNSDRELALWQEARKQFEHVSIERLLSGSGLQFIYQALNSLDGNAPAPLSPNEISEHAINNSCAYSREALNSFCAILGSTAGDIALTLGARGGVFIGGGIAPAIGQYLANSCFRARFENKGRFSHYLAAIPTFLIDSPYAALRGAASYLDAYIND